MNLHPAEPFFEEPVGLAVGSLEDLERRIVTGVRRRKAMGTTPVNSAPLDHAVLRLPPAWTSTTPLAQLPTLGAP